MKNAKSAKSRLFFEARVKRVLQSFGDAELSCIGMEWIQKEICSLRDDCAWYSEESGLSLLKPSGSDIACDVGPGRPIRREI